MHDLVEVYLDESGDLGFSPNSSRYLVIAATVATSKVNFDRIVKKGNEKLKIKGKSRAEVKFNNSDDWMRHFYIDRFCDTSCHVHWCAIEKSDTKEHLIRCKDKLYNYMCGKLMASIFGSYNAHKFNMIVDKRAGGRAERNDFDRYMNTILEHEHMGNFLPELRLSHYDSFNNPGLRVHDFVVGSIFQHLERRNDEYYGKIKHMVDWGKMLW